MDTGQLNEQKRYLCMAWESARRPRYRAGVRTTVLSWERALWPRRVCDTLAGCLDWTRGMPMRSSVLERGRSLGQCGERERRSGEDCVEGVCDPACTLSLDIAAAHRRRDCQGRGGTSPFWPLAVATQRCGSRASAPALAVAVGGSRRRRAWALARGVPASVERVVGG